MPADLLIYGLVAAGLVFWLRNILGTRHGEERERPNPLKPAEPKKDDTPYLAPIEGSATREKESENPAPAYKVFAAPRAQEGLSQIAQTDRGFDINHFITGAKDAFAIIVEAFAQKDRQTLRDLLTPALYPVFEQALIARDHSGQALHTEIHAIRRAEIVEARLQGRNAFITVKFVADETLVLRDAQGNILEGNPDRVSEMRDIWTFTRDIKARDPRWLLAETRGDFEGDNKTLPNSV
ncbi:MAG: Tim44/TimA family putative adaptor protein [Alphaproteobacteria bacterium]|nr:Tim44/TimA family putative adaptor protein [Alphaproteobacteria bacterium]